VVAITPPRTVALDVLRRVGRGELADHAFSQASRGLEPREQAWVQELTYGTLRLRGRIDYLLGKFVRAGLESLDQTVLDVLRLGAYQLTEMGSVPAYAAVSQSVELARSAGAARAAGLVNGVLQSFNRDWRSAAFPGFDEDPLEHLVSWGSHPRWLVERWIARWGSLAARDLVEANNQRPQLFLTPIGVAIEDAVAALGDAGIVAEPVEFFPGSLWIVPPATPSDALAIVPGVIQDPAAASVVRFAAVPPGATAVDVSSAPGGKTAGLTENADYVAAADLSVSRLRRVRDNIERVGRMDRVGLVVADGRLPPFRPVDLVLLDAPCTGTGTFKRHPDGRWRITASDITALAKLQRELLAACAQIVQTGGVLVYSTCSLEPEENEEQVDRFLGSHPEFEVMAPPDDFVGTMVKEKYLNVLPHLHGVDGAFAVRLKRVS